MKRVRTVTATEGGRKVRITVEVLSTDGLTRDESAALLTNLTDAVMVDMANARYLNANLSELVVK